MDGLQERLDTVAKYYLSIGLSIVPIGADKKPVIKWAEHMEKPLANWRFPGCNIALLTGQFNGVVVADCDSEESYIGWLKTKTPTPLRVKTKRGMQFYYRHPGVYIKSDSHIKDPSGFEYDVKGDKSYVVAPPSFRSGHQYQFCVCSSNIRGKLIPFSQLPVFNPEWRPERERASGSNLRISTSQMERQDQLELCGSSNRISTIRDGIKYIQSIRAIAGCGGDKETFRAACKLIESGMSESEALLALLDWNDKNADPPWTRQQLLYKVQRALAEARV
jgi:hypothetical protein